MPSETNWAAVLVELRRVQRKSQAQLANDVGANQKSISLWETGRQPIPEDVQGSILASVRALPPSQKSELSPEIVDWLDSQHRKDGADEGIFSETFSYPRAVYRGLSDW